MKMTMCFFFSSSSHIYLAVLYVFKKLELELGVWLSW